MMNGFMQLAIAKARSGMKKGGGPFGACIVKKGKVIACEHNSVWPDLDSTAHAEVNAIRAAEKRLKTINLSGCTIYSTTEPCPMCFSAIHWARIDKIVYGASTEDAKKAGFNELAITDSTLKRLGKSRVRVEGGLMKEACAALFKEWKAAGGKAY
jgi:tRNA(Arg) A34 adenosine deaminase TadA